MTAASSLVTVQAQIWFRRESLARITEGAVRRLLAVVRCTPRIKAPRSYSGGRTSGGGALPSLCPAAGGRLGS